MIANVDPLTVGLSSVIGTPFSATFTGSSTGNTIGFTGGALPPEVEASINAQYRLSDGSTSTLNLDFTTNLNNILDNPSLSANTAVVYGVLPENDFYTLTASYPNIINEYDCDTVNIATNDLSADSNDPWYYANFDITSGNAYSGYSFFYNVSTLTSGASSTFTGTITGKTP